MTTGMTTDMEMTPAKIQTHIDVISCLHFPIADNSENRKKFEEYLCSICSEIGCTGKRRCRATSMTMAQLNLLTGIVSFRDEGSIELGIGEFDRIVTIGKAIRPFNPALADYFDENGGENEKLHIIICMAKSKDPSISLGKLIIPKEYNIKTEKLYRK